MSTPITPSDNSTATALSIAWEIARLHYPMKQGQNVDHQQQTEEYAAHVGKLANTMLENAKVAGRK